jgi:PAS domain S-box-containing protein
MEAAGLTFIISCKPLSRPVYIDSEMWEKIVLNLLSNALKFTISGTVEISLGEDANNAQLSVRDTGVGIPEAEIPRVFERFHRIEGTRGRTHEGTGIGLALVDELVRLHGGAVFVQSEPGSGTTFTVQIPFGSDHLPADRVVEGTHASASTVGALPYLQEALRWLPNAASGTVSLLRESANQDLTVLLDGQGSCDSQSARIVLADDNRDMREYVERLLARSYHVTAVEDGEHALAAILDNPPDLVLSDVMMPGIDGFGVIRELRANPVTAAIPVILLSARAGEEARTEGMEAGADDYLVKPFTARELMTRVGAHIKMHRLRSQLREEEREQRLAAERAESKYRMILHSISEGFIFVDRAWTVGYINDQAALIAGLHPDDLIGKTIWTVFSKLEHTVFGEAFRKAVETGEVQRVEDYYAPMDRWLHSNVYSNADGLSIFIQDVSEVRKQQEHLLTTEKLAATGRLAATIAHEINNPLEAVLNLLYLARISTSASPEKIHHLLLTAEQELTRVSQIARHTTGFYRETSVPVDIELSRVLDEVLTVYRSRLAASRIEVIKKFDLVPTIHALRGELNQVFSNLISNAVDAMREGGRLRLLLTAADHDLRSGIEVIVEDNGCGVELVHREKLFEPFFTTKTSVGTGLGLWVVKQFIENYGGTVSVQTSTDPLDHGTRFTIFLPSITTAPIRRQVM